MLPGTLTGLRGSFSLRLASTFNHRPDMIILNYYTRKMEKKQAIFRKFFILDGLSFLKDTRFCARILVFPLPESTLRL